MRNLISSFIPQPKLSAVGVVYGRDGWPRIDPDFIRTLSDHHRAALESDLLAHGFRLLSDSTIEEIL